MKHEEYRCSLRGEVMPINYLDGRKVRKSVQNLLAHFPVQAFIAREINDRLMQHQPEGFLSYDGVNLLQEYDWLMTEKQYLSYPDNNFDMVVAPLVPLWVRDLDDFFPEILRVLKPGGVFLMATLGVDSLKELRSSFAVVDDAKHVHRFYDMHDIGDKLFHGGFVHPVMDSERLVLMYPEVSGLVQDLTQSGLRNSLVDQRKTCLTLQQWKRVCEVYKNNFSDASGYTATLEVIYGCAKKPYYEVKQMNQQAEVSVFVRDIKIR